LGLCGGRDAKTHTEPMILLDEDDREYEVNFRCGKCGMEIIFGRKKQPPT